MPFVSQGYFEHLSAEEQAKLLAASSPLGFHPASRDTLYLPDSERYAGTYVLGVQGVGKSGLLENMITRDILQGKAVVVIDPHGDLTNNCLAALPPHMTSNVFMLDMEDETHPFGMNLFAIGRAKTQIAAAQAVSRIMHVFEVLWPEVITQQHLPRYLRAATLVLLDNPGATLLDMYNLLTDDNIRTRLVLNVTDPTVRNFWRTQYEDLGDAERTRRVQPLINRLESLFMGRSIIRNIVGQRKSTISFRRAIERKEAVFIKLPVKLVQQDAELIGTIIVAQLSAAVFSFADIAEDKRPGVSLYVDEFQHFSTPDFASLFTEGRKFGMRVAVAHQYRGQLPEYLRQSTMTARTKVVFKPTPEDAREMAPLFPITDSSVAPEDIDMKAADALLFHSAEYPQDVQVFVKTYLQPLRNYKRGGTVYITNPGTDIYGGLMRFVGSMQGIESSHDAIEVTDPLPFLNVLLFEVMRQGNAYVTIPAEVARGFSNSGQGFFAAVRNIAGSPELLPSIQYPPHLVVQTPGGPQWTKRPSGPKEQLYHFIFYLRQTLDYLAAHPIGKVNQPSTADVSKIIHNLPRRTAYVRTGEVMALVRTFDTPPKLVGDTLTEYLAVIRDQTRARYCHPRDEVEETFAPRVIPAGQPASPLAAAVDGVVASRWQEVDEL